MPDTPARPVIGVRVRADDGLSFTHDEGRDWHLTGGYLHVMSGGAAGRAIACYAHDAWQSVELVHSEPEPAAPIVDAPIQPGTPHVTTPGGTVYVSWNPSGEDVRAVRDAIRQVDREDARPAREEHVRVAARALLAWLDGPDPDVRDREVRDAMELLRRAIEASA